MLTEQATTSWPMPHGEEASSGVPRGIVARLCRCCRWHMLAIMVTGAGCMATVAILVYHEAQKAQWLAGSLAVVQS
ncbi:hypothetical protein MTO96_003184 [Rhipicephalus appendiculatus]